MHSISDSQVLSLPTLAHLKIMAAPPNHGDVLSMILVMGVTGSGKSYFINKLAGEYVVETGEDLKSCQLLMRALFFYALTVLNQR